MVLGMYVFFLRHVFAEKKQYNFMYIYVHLRVRE